MIFEFLIVTEQRHMSELGFREIWRALDNPLFTLQKYDIREPFRNKYIADQYQDAYEMLEKGLILKGKNNFFGAIDYRITGTIDWRFNIDTGTFGEAELTEILNLLTLLHRICVIIYGRGASEPEYDLKHKEITDYEDGGRSIGWRGQSFWDFCDFLPGIYWLNLFGRELTEALGREKVLGLKEVDYLRTDNDLIIFKLQDPFASENVGPRLAVESKLREQLGRDYFFDITEKDRAFSHPSGFKRYLERLESEE